MCAKECPARVSHRSAMQKWRTTSHNVSHKSVEECHPKMYLKSVDQECQTEFGRLRLCTCVHLGLCVFIRFCVLACRFCADFSYRFIDCTTSCSSRWQRFVQVSHANRCGMMCSTESTKRQTKSPFPRITIGKDVPQFWTWPLLYHP